jgi:hypothetical protein
MYLLDWNTLQKGDIILSRSNERESITVRQRTNGQYSHVSLYTGTLYCIHSSGLGVETVNIQRLIFESKDDVAVLRYLKDITDESLNKIVAFARKKIGTEFDSKEAKLSATINDNLAQTPNRQFCTRLVAQAYTNAGIAIVKNPDYCSPRDIYDSELLTKVEFKLREASPAEVNFAKESITLLTINTEANNNIFESARNLTGLDIQTFGQLADFVKKNPTKEQKVIDILVKSGFLNLIKTDMLTNPWHYNYSEFHKYYTTSERRKEVAQVFVDKEPELRSRYFQSLESLRLDFSFLEQEYFQILIDNFEELIKFSNQREEMCYRILNES